MYGYTWHANNRRKKVYFCVPSFDCFLSYNRILYYVFNLTPLSQYLSRINILKMD